MNTDRVNTTPPSPSTFGALQSLADVAALLDVSPQELGYILYRLPPDKRYRSFDIPKRTGGKRTICAPIGGLKRIQSRLNMVLQELYAATYGKRHHVHGFRTGHSIVTNAVLHVDKRYVLNVDLLDFFPSINFGRIRGMFMAVPFRTGEQAATTLAKICCHDNMLPQGAPTSPILSNFICARMDSELSRLTKCIGCVYSRYADDITISTNKHRFPAQIASCRLEPDGSRGPVNLGHDFSDVIRCNGFETNPQKTRLLTQPYRREVTGLVVDEKVNVRRPVIRQVRAMLNAWEKYGYKKAQSEWRRKYRKSSSKTPTEHAQFRKTVRGQIEFIRMVRAINSRKTEEVDIVHGRLLFRYEKLVRNTHPLVVGLNPTDLAEAIWVVEEDISISEEKENVSQGTAFFLNGIGMITCHHVLSGKMKTFHTNRSTDRFPISIVKFERDADIAICEFPQKISCCLSVGTTKDICIGKEVFVAGFPNHRLADSLRLQPAKVSGFRANKYFGDHKWILLDSKIIAGNSGGPVLDQFGRVIGIAARGESASEDKPTEMHGVIPIEVLLQLLQTRIAQ